MKPKLLKAAKWGGAFVVMAAVTLYATAVNDIRRLTPLELVHCSHDPTPVYRWTCEQFVKHENLTPAEVAQLDNEAGAYYVTGIQGEHREAILKRWLDQGVQMNAHDQRTKSHATALHLAAALGDARDVELLLRHGADSTIKDGTGLTPLEQAKRAYVRFPDPRKKQVIAVLEQAEKGP